jgi:hypothetical protein
MLMGVSSKWKGSKYVLRYTRFLMDASLKFPIYFLKVYTMSGIMRSLTHACSRIINKRRRDSANCNWSTCWKSN